MEAFTPMLCSLEALAGHTSIFRGQRSGIWRLIIRWNRYNLPSLLNVNVSRGSAIELYLSMAGQNNLAV